MANELEGLRVAFLVANEGIEQVELTEPWKAVEAAGGSPELVAPKPGKAQAMNHMDLADTFAVDRTTEEVSAEDYDAAVLPGGVANPDQLRLDGPAVELIRRLFSAGKPVAAICHGPWTLVEADVVRDRTLTSWPSLRTDITNAGGHWVDEEVQVCTSGPNTLVTSRKPDNLKAFCREFTPRLRAEPFRQRALTPLGVDRATGSGEQRFGQALSHAPCLHRLVHLINLIKRRTPTMTTPSTSAIVDLLERDHREVERLLGQLEVTPPHEREGYFWQVVPELIMHEVAEGLVVYPAVRSAYSEPQVEARLDEQFEAEAQLLELERCDRSGAEFAKKFAALRSTVLQHDKAVELTIFPLLRCPEGLTTHTELGPRYERATTPDLPPGNRLVGTIATLFDWARDLASRH